MVKDVFEKARLEQLYAHDVRIGLDIFIVTRNSKHQNLCPKSGATLIYPSVLLDLNLTIILVFK